MSKILICPECTFTTFDAKFCPECGTESMEYNCKCRYCNQNLLPSWKYCGNCGHKVNEGKNG